MPEVPKLVIKRANGQTETYLLPTQSHKDVVQAMADIGVDGKFSFPAGWSGDLTFVVVLPTAGDIIELSMADIPEKQV